MCMCKLCFLSAFLSSFVSHLNTNGLMMSSNNTLCLFMSLGEILPFVCWFLLELLSKFLDMCAKGSRATFL